MNAEQLESSLLDFLAPRIPEGEELEPETDLLESGAMDSLLMMELIAHIEAKYAVRLENTDLSPRNFRTVAAVARLIAGKRAPGA